MKNLQKGFTLIELMIVIAIISILAAFALPAYGDYTKRTYVAEGLALSAAAKTAIMDTRTVLLFKRNDDNANKSLGLREPKEIKGQAVDSITVKAHNRLPVIYIAYNSKVAEGAVLGLALDGSVAGSAQWLCGRYKPDNMGPAPGSGHAGANPGGGMNVAYDTMEREGVTTDALLDQWLPANCRGKYSDSEY